jgi:hypothetical protein
MTAIKLNLGFERKNRKPRQNAAKKQHVLKEARVSEEKQ